MMSCVEAIVRSAVDPLRGVATKSPLKQAAASRRDHHRLPHRYPMSPRFLMRPLVNGLLEHATAPEHGGWLRLAANEFGEQAR